ncbi:unnamed protein product [Rotaria sp. Silwood2]|nr:unnamed protein product [Rotaria sp. Silwood2]CAF2865153.1 unnamed protein product [Rotaria sp. Silwood2]CAF4188257.1 unnamed protein product [Rotaria sp. Silwood2]CAF4198252.1 unnamed protein product [Rotaria sp. Silwood2]
MLFLHQYIILSTLATLFISVIGQKACQDFSADEESCTKFIRCFQNLRIRFTCAPGTAWEDSLKTCVWIEQVEGCKKVKQQRKLDIDNDMITYDADINALNDIPVGQTLVEARALGPILTPRQYRCSFCSTGLCGIVVNTIQCFCGNTQCPPVTTATTTVQPRNPCADNPCFNGGQCAPVGQGFICNCPETFTGNRCEAPVPTPCQPNPCQNGGTCVPQGTSFYCQCPSTFTGFCCENRVTTTTPFNPCAQSPCQNGGQCMPAGNSFVCQCPSGFYGMRCESRNYCMPNPCCNNGLCTQTTTGYICSCTFPYTGTNCQQMITTTTTTTTTTTVATRAPCGGSCACIITPCPMVIVTNPCVPNPCQNMGGCAVQNRAARCFCPDSYQGYYCQFRLSARSLMSKKCDKTCLNGGQCYIDEQQGGKAQCSCPNEYYGPRCEYVNRPKSCSPKNPCMNDGKCVTTSVGSQCVCKQGTSGVLCERIERSLKEKYCPLNCQADGICVYVGSTAKCHCKQGRTGRLCEIYSG